MSTHKARTNNERYDFFSLLPPQITSAPAQKRGERRRRLTRSVKTLSLSLSRTHARTQFCHVKEKEKSLFTVQKVFGARARSLARPRSHGRGQRSGAARSGSSQWGDREKERGGNQGLALAGRGRGPAREINNPGGLLQRGREKPSGCCRCCCC